MKTYYVTDTQQQAVELELLIRGRGFALATQIGRNVTSEGLASERYVPPDPDDPESIGGMAEDLSVRTTAWDVPRERSDGRWMVEHPQHHPAAANPAYLAFVTNGITADVEVSDETWWPAVQEENT